MTGSKFIEISLTERDAYARSPFAPKEAAAKVVSALLADEPLIETSLSEATVHRPQRGRIWVASFTGPAGGQVWRSTRLTDQHQALRLAKRWEAEARAERERRKPMITKPTLRVRRSDPYLERGLLTQKEVALLLNMSERGVREAEKRAIRKLFNHPALRQIWKQYLTGELDEQVFILTPKEIAALFHLARSSEERLLIYKVLRLIQA
jgi:hypothetical protein